MIFDKTEEKGTANPANSTLREESRGKAARHCQLHAGGANGSETSQG